MSLNVNLEHVDRIGGLLRVASSSYYYLIADGQLPGHNSGLIKGYNASVGTAMEDVTPTSGVINIPATAVAMEIVGGAQDNATGTGARLIRISGLDTNFNMQGEDVIPNGITAVALTKTYRRINNMAIIDAGTGQSAAGVILIRAAGAGVTYSQISIGDTTAMQALYTVPANMKGFILAWSGSSSLKDTRIVLKATRTWDSPEVILLFNALDNISVMDSGMTIPFTCPIRVNPKTDVKVSAIGLNAGSVVSASVQMFIEPV